MKYIIESDELRDHELALNGHRMAQFIGDLLERLRSKYKHTDDPMLHSQDFRTEVIEMLSEYGIPDHLIH